MPRTGANGWPHAIIGYNNDNTLIERSSVHDNHGEGIGPFLSCSHWYMRDNVVYDNWSLNIYFDTQMGSCVAERNLCYNTGAYYTGSDWRNLPVHIGIHNENADLGWNWTDPDGGVVDSIVVKNNICVGQGQSFRSFPYANGPSSYRHVVVANNTFASDPVEAGTQAMRVRKGDNFRIVNNIIAQGSVLLEDGVGAGIAFESNLVTSGTVTVSGSGVSHSGTIVASAGFAGGAPYAPASFRLATGSEAVGAGAAVAEVDDDFYSAARSGAMDLGALIYGATVVGAQPSAPRAACARRPLLLVAAGGRGHVGVAHSLSGRLLTEQSGNTRAQAVVIVQ